MSRFDTRAALLRTSAVAALMALGTQAHAAGPTLVGGGSTLAEPTYATVLPTVGLSIETTSCTATTDFAYALAGSGAGSTAFVNNDPSQFNTSFTTVCPTGPAPSVSYGAGDLPIANNYANGSTVFKTNTGYQMIQVPAFGTPVTVPFNIPKNTKDAGVKLTDDDLCGIFSGKITTFAGLSTPPVKSTGLSIAVSYRQDSSGTTFLLTNHLASVCNSGNSNITFTGMTTFAKEFPGYTCSGTPALCTVPGGTFAADISAKGSGGVAGKIYATPATHFGNLGYVGPDYTDISVTGRAGATPLPVSSVEGTHETTFFAPNTANTLAALSQASIPPTSATNPDSFGILVPLVSNGYPIVGYTYLYLSSQYSSATKVADVKSFLDALYNVDGTNSAAYTAITNGGFVAVPGVTSNKAVVTKGKVKLAGTIVNDYLSAKAVVPFTVSVGGR